jgi:hypothetical protein
MAHYAKLDDQNNVLEVIVVSNSDELLNGKESEEKGVEFCRLLTGHQHWKKTSYNGAIRKNYAGIGSTYDPTLDAFVLPQPFPSWVLNSNAQWESPIEKPIDGKMYQWDEVGQQWQEVTP